MSPAAYRSKNTAKHIVRVCFSSSDSTSGTQHAMTFDNLALFVKIPCTFEGDMSRSLAICLNFFLSVFPDDTQLERKSKAYPRCHLLQHIFCRSWTFCAICSRLTGQTPSNLWNIFSIPIVLSWCLSYSDPNLNDCLKFNVSSWRHDTDTVSLTAQIKKSLFSNRV